MTLQKRKTDAEIRKEKREKEWQEQLLFFMYDTPFIRIAAGAMTLYITFYFAPSLADPKNGLITLGSFLIAVYLFVSGGFSFWNKANQKATELILPIAMIGIVIMLIAINAVADAIAAP